MDGIGPWTAGIAMTGLSLLGLAVASAAVDAPFHLFGLALFTFGVCCVFALIVRHTGNRTGHRSAGSSGQEERLPAPSGRSKDELAPLPSDAGADAGR